MKKQHRFLTHALIVVSAWLIAVTYQSGGPFGSNDTTTIVYPMDCYSCRETYGGFNFCNVNNEFGACCPEKSTDTHYCLTNTHYNVKCTTPESNYELYYTNCLRSSSKQCGEHEKLEFLSEEQIYSVEVADIKKASGQSCYWEIISSLDKQDYFKIEVSLNFVNITNLEVMIVTGYTTHTMYTLYENIESGVNIILPIYNTSYIIALPMQGKDQTMLQFEAKIERQLNHWIDDMDVRKIITGTITAGGVILFLIVMGVICMYRKVKILRLSHSGGRTSVHPFAGGNRLKRVQHAVLDGEPFDNSMIDFEDKAVSSDNKTLESPKSPGSNEGKEDFSITKKPTN